MEWRRRLRTVTLGNGLEEIGEHEFMYRTSLREIVMPNAVKLIMDGDGGWVIQILLGVLAGNVLF